MKLLRSFSYLSPKPLAALKNQQPSRANKALCLRSEETVYLVTLPHPESAERRSLDPNNFHSPVLIDQLVALGDLCLPLCRRGVLREPKIGCYATICPSPSRTRRALPGHKAREVDRLPIKVFGASEDPVDPEFTLRIAERRNKRVQIEPRGKVDLPVPLRSRLGLWVSRLQRLWGSAGAQEAYEDEGDERG